MTTRPSAIALVLVAGCGGAAATTPLRDRAPASDQTEPVAATSAAEPDEEPSANAEPTEAAPEAPARIAPPGPDPCPTVPYDAGPYVVRCEEDFWVRRRYVSLRGREGSGMVHSEPLRRVAVAITGEASALIRHRLTVHVENEARRCWFAYPTEPPPTTLTIGVVISPPRSSIRWSSDGATEGAIAECAALGITTETSSLRLPAVEQVEALAIEISFVVEDDGR